MRQARVAVDVPPATPPAITMVGDKVVMDVFRKAVLCPGVPLTVGVFPNLAEPVTHSCLIQHLFGGQTEHWPGVDVLFHGIFASSRAIPQVSVIPANMSPAPTKAGRPRKYS